GSESMVGSNTVSGLEPFGDGFGRQPRRQRDEGHGGARAQPAPVAAGTDSVELALSEAAVFLLLEQRVLAATRQRVGAGDPPGALVRAGMPASPAAAVARIQSAQHWCLGGAAADAMLLGAAFRDGLAETETILRDVARADVALQAWFAAVRAVLGG